MRLKRILSILWVIALFALLIGGLFTLGNGVAALKEAGFHIHPVYTQE